MESEPNDLERRELVVVPVLALLMTELGVTDPVEQMCRFTGEGVLWAAAYQITDGDIDKAIDHEPRDERIELELNFNREQLIGHWLMTGSDTAYGKAFRFPTEEAAAFAYTLAEDYLTGPTGDE